MKKFEQFGKVIRRTRETSGLTQVELGAKIGVISQALSNCERGQAGLPARAIRKLVNLYPRAKSSIKKGLREDRIQQAEREIERIFESAK